MTFHVRGTLAVLAVSACVVSGCGSTCVDDGLVSQQNQCPSVGGNSATETDSATDSTDSATDSTPTDSNSQSQSDPTMASMSMSESNSATDTTTLSTVSATDTDPSTVSATDTDTATATDSDSDSDSDTDTGGGGDWCVDADMDGFGDPGQCTPVNPGDEPPPGTVPNDDDCDDGDANTFPGAAENEDPDACMQDEDNDGWGDNMPDDPGVEPGTDCNDGDVNTFPGAAPNDDAMACMTDADGDDYGDDTPEGRGVDPGTDCDDTDVNTFPGAAENEGDMMACTKDEDGDGWGDASVPPGVDGGKDCHDNNPNYNPDQRVLFTMVDNLAGIVSQIDIETGMVTPLATLIPPVGAWAPYSAAVSPVDGKIFAHNSANTKTRLITFDYCDDGSTPEELENHGQSICGLAFNNDGVLFGIDSGENALVTFDTTTGAITDTKPLMIGNNNLDVVSCGMSYDCVGDRLLMTQGQQSRVFEVDPESGAVTEISNPMGGDWTSVGAEYDVVSEQMYVVNGTPFFQVALDGSDQLTPLPNLSIATNDLTFGPVCP
jgi:hypothetical protein